MITVLVMGAVALVLTAVVLAVVRASDRPHAGPWDRVTPEQVRTALGGMRLPGEPLNDPYIVGIPEQRSEGNNL